MKLVKVALTGLLGLAGLAAGVALDKAGDSYPVSAEARDAVAWDNDASNNYM